MLLQAQSPKPGLSAKAKAQIDSVRRAVAEFADPRVAEDSGYEPVFGLIPLQGVHYVRSDLIKGGKFDLTKPPVLMYAPVKGEPQLVGVAYAYQHPRNEPPPEGFDGRNDDWHSHDELSRDPDKHIVMVTCGSRMRPADRSLDITPTCRTWPRISSVRRQRSSTPTRRVASERVGSHSRSRSRRIRLRCSM
jgi:hypothetical protein